MSILRWVIWLIGGAFVWAAIEFSYLVISAARSGRIADYISTLIVAVALFVVGAFLVAKTSPLKRDQP